MDIHTRLAGKRIAEVLHNGQVLCIRTHDGAEVLIAWVDDNGKLVKGRPAVAQSGVRIQAASLKDLANLPALGVKEHA